MKYVALCLLGIAGSSSLAAAQDASLFKGKTVEIIIPSPPGGGTDSSGRLIAAYLGKYLPDNPNIIIRNIPGANGMTGLNHFIARTANDGLTLAMASSTQSDPAFYRVPQAQFDPTKFAFIGGVGRGGTALVINSAVADQRLLDKTKPPVVMGVVGSYPRTGQLATAWGIEFLGWNARWVMGYPGTNDLLVALERGEVDMTTTGVVTQLQRLQANGKFRVLSQSGALEGGKLVPREAYGNAATISSLMKGKINDPVAAKAFQYWVALTLLDKWLAAPPNAPPAYLAAYRKAFSQAVVDPELIKRIEASGEDFEPMSHEDLKNFMNTIGSTSQDAIDYLSTMVTRQAEKK
jgi:tripartite-type tricarboxylate transporter receptor subunit TctC